MISIPFPGGKRYSYKNVKEIVQSGGYEAVYEPFGGSCVLSVNLFNDQIVKKAVVNDYDHFFDLYPEYLDLKDKVVEEGYRRGLRRTTGRSNCRYKIELDGSRTPVKSVTLQGEEREILQDIVSKYVPEEFYRYFAMNSNLTHSAVYTHEKIYLRDFTKFDRYVKTDRQRAFLEVLNKVEMEHLDCFKFLDKYEAEIKDPKSILILDPPYVGTAQNQYKGQFTEEDTVKLIDRVKELGCDFIFFNHNQEQMEGWLKGLNYSIQITGNSTSSANRKRKDVMAYVRCL